MATSSSDIGNVVKCFMDAHILPGTNVGPSFQPCIHTVCRNCVDTNNPQERKRRGERLKCQTCNFEAEYADVKCFQRPDDFITELIRLSIKVFGTKVCCDYNRQYSCSHEYYCLQCEKLLCLMCEGEHSGSGHNVSDSRSHIPKTKFAHTDFSSLHKSQLEICCVECSNALCIVCYLENDKTVHNIVNSDYERVQCDASTLKKALSERKEILDTEIQKINTEPYRIERKIDEQATKLKNLLEMCSKTLKHRMKDIQEEEKSRLESEVQSVEQKLRVITTNFNSVGTGSLQGKDIVSYLSKRTGLNDLQGKCNEILHQCPKKSQLCFEPASNHDPFNEDIIGTFQGQSLQPQSRVSTLANLGNTDFLNVIIQVLCHTNIFVKLLSEGLPIAKENRRVKGDSITALVKLFSSMLSKDDQRQHYPTEFYDSLQDKFKKFTDLNQHDCHDLMIHLLNRIRQEEREFLGITSTKHRNNAENAKDCIHSKDLTVVDKVFGGHIFTAYICTNCFQPYHLCDPFLALSLSIYERQASHTVYDTDGFNNSNTGGILQDGTPYQRAVAQALKPFGGPDVTVNGGLENTLLSSLEHFTRFEYMKDEYLCKKCNAKFKDNQQMMTSAAKRTLIYSPPAILTIHLKRFQQDSVSVGFVKNDEHIQFNHHLDIAPFCSSGCLNVDPRVKNIWYMLYGVVVHWGTLRSGHYLIYVMVREDESDMKDFLQKEFLDHDSRFGERELIERMKKLSSIGKRCSVKPSRPTKLNTWYRISDGQCDVVRSYTGTADDEILRQDAYMLFYERVGPIP